MNPEVSQTCPTDAERARAVVARCASAEVIWLDPAPGEARQRHTVPGLVVVTTEAPAGPCGPGRPVLAEVAEASPLPVRDRIRARVRMSGYGAIEPGSPATLLLRAAAVQLVRDDDVTPVSLAEFTAAAIDPFTEAEWGLLSHLMAAHPDLIERLTRLIEPRHLLQGVIRVWPQEVDRFGIVLRLEYARGHCEVRLTFPTPAHSVSQLRDHMRALAAQAVHAECRSRLAPRSSP